MIGGASDNERDGTGKDEEEEEDAKEAAELEEATTEAGNGARLSKKSMQSKDRGRNWS